MGTPKRWESCLALSPGSSVKLAWRLGIWLALGYVCSLGAAPAVSSSQASLPKNAGKLREFLIKQPPIEYAVIQTSNVMVEGFSKLQGNRNNSLGNQVRMLTRHQGSRQAGNFYVRHATGSLEESAKLGTNSPSLAGRADGIVWYATARFAAKSQLSSAEEAEFPNYQGTNNVIAVAAVNAKQFSRLLDFGLIDIKPGTFKFEGNRFKVLLNRGAEADGELILQDDTITAIRFHIIGDAKYVVSELVYLPSPSIPEFLPAKVIQRVFDETGRFLNVCMEYEFVELRLATRPLAPDYFLPDRFYNLAGQKMQTAELFYTNHAVFQRMGTNLILVGMAQASQPVRSSRRITVIAVLALSAVGMYGLVRKLQKQQPKTQNENESSDSKKRG